MDRVKIAALAKRLAASGGIIAYFIMAFEVMIMISPFAFFFYSVFNPLFHWLDQYSVGKALTSFFLPHMVLPPTFALKAIRVSGSVLFVLGSLAFLVCALQVYLGKLFKWGIADHGLYTYIRHPQYVALGVWGIGLAVLWPRCLVLATLAIMFVLYYLLAKDEERRMLGQYGAGYEAYMNRTGTFFPRWLEQRFSFLQRLVPNAPLRYAATSALIVAVVAGVGLGCRDLTVRSFPLESAANITMLPILPEDAGLSAGALAGIARGEADGRVRFLSPADRKSVV